MAFSIERGVIRKVYRARMKDHGWIAIPIIDLLNGETVTPPATHDDWPIAYMGDFVGEQVEVIFSSKGKYALLPFHNQHYAIFPGLAKCMHDGDPTGFKDLPKLQEILDAKSGKLREQMDKVIAAKCSLDQVFDELEETL